MGRRRQSRASFGTDASLEGSRLEILGRPLGGTPMLAKKPSLFHRDGKEKQPLVAGRGAPKRTTKNMLSPGRGGVRLRGGGGSSGQGVGF